MLHLVVAAALLGLPTNVSTDARLRSCSSPQYFSLHNPHVIVSPKPEGRSLRVSLELIAADSTSLNVKDAFDKRGFAASSFIAVDDGPPIFLALEPGRRTELVFVGLAARIHLIRYGIVYRRVLLNGGTMCVRLRSPD
jgi:hypothetical protein